MSDACHYSLRARPPAMTRGTTFSAIDVRQTDEQGRQVRFRRGAALQRTGVVRPLVATILDRLRSLADRLDPRLAPQPPTPLNFNLQFSLRHAPPRSRTGSHGHCRRGGRLRRHGSCRRQSAIRGRSARRTGWDDAWRSARRRHGNSTDPDRTRPAPDRMPNHPRSTSPARCWPSPAETSLLSG